MATSDLTTSALYLLMVREFNRARPSTCPECTTPLPRKRQEGGWSIPAVAPCPQGCRAILDEVVDRLRDSHGIDLQRDPFTPRDPLSSA